MGGAVIGAIWAGRTIYYSGFHAGAGTSGGATLAPIGAQIAGLHDAFRTAAFLTIVALLISIRAYIQETGGSRQINSSHPSDFGTNMGRLNLDRYKDYS